MIPLIQLFVMFFRIGFFSFGGGYAMLPLIFQGVQEFGIMSSTEFSRLVALSQVTPGPIAVNAATYVGYQYAGFWGAVAATIGVSLPSILLITLIMHFIRKFRENQALGSVLHGIRPATVGMIFSAVIFLSESSLFNGKILSSELIYHTKEYVNLLPCLFFLVTIILSGKFKVGPIKLTILAGLIGAFFIR